MLDRLRRWADSLYDGGIDGWHHSLHRAEPPNYGGELSWVQWYQRQAVKGGIRIVTEGRPVYDVEPVVAPCDPLSEAIARIAELEEQLRQRDLDAAARAESAPDDQEG
jgi:hypothetical protein